MQSVVNSIHAGQLGDYTWVIDEIMIEEAESKVASSDYQKPFKKVTNANGIQISAISNNLAEDLFGLLGFLVGINLNIPSTPSQAHLQSEKISNKKNKKNIKRLQNTMITMGNSDYVMVYVGDDKPSPPRDF